MTKIVHISVNDYMGQPQYTIYYQDGEGEPTTVLLAPGLWNRSVIVDALIRSKYAQDEVEAIINNHFLNIAEWLDKKFAGSTDKFIDEAYDDMQSWRKVCKAMADEAIAQYPPIR